LNTGGVATVGAGVDPAGLNVNWNPFPDAAGALAALSVEEKVGVGPAGEGLANENLKSDGKPPWSPNSFSSGFTSPCVASSLVLTDSICQRRVPKL